MTSLRGLLAGLWWRVCGVFDGSDFSLLYRPGRPVRVRGRIPQARVPGIVAFLADDLHLRSPVVVRGTKTAGIWRLAFSSGLRRPEAQRLRNFLTEHLS